MNYFSILFPVICISILFGLMYSNPTINAAQVDRYWSVLEAYDKSPSTTYAHGFIGVKFREDFKQLVYNVNVNNIDNITGIYLSSRGSNNEDPKVILDLLQEAKEVRVKDKFKEVSILLNRKHEVEGSVCRGCNI